MHPAHRCRNKSSPVERPIPPAAQHPPVPSTPTIGSRDITVTDIQSRILKVRLQQRRDILQTAKKGSVLLRAGRSIIPAPGRGFTIARRTLAHIHGPRNQASLWGRGTGAPVFRPRRFRRECRPRLVSQPAASLGGRLRRYRPYLGPPPVARRPAWAPHPVPSCRERGVLE